MTVRWWWSTPIAFAVSRIHPLRLPVSVSISVCLCLCLSLSVPPSPFPVSLPASICSLFWSILFHGLCRRAFDVVWQVPPSVWNKAFCLPCPLHAKNTVQSKIKTLPSARAGAGVVRTAFLVLSLFMRHHARGNRTLSEHMHCCSFNPFFPARSCACVFHVLTRSDALFEIALHSVSLVLVRHI